MNTKFKGKVNFYLTIQYSFCHLLGSIKCIVSCTFTTCPSQTFLILLVEKNKVRFWVRDEGYGNGFMSKKQNAFGLRGCDKSGYYYVNSSK